jgi:RNA polymerase sigma factor (sigma-70 family)
LLIRVAAVEAGTVKSAARSTGIGLLAGRSPLLRLQNDERLIALVRSGNDGAFEVLFGRYRPRLLAFCRHMLGSREDAEDVLQDVWVAAYNAILADQRDINARPWLYRIARNRSLNHLRRPVPEGRDTMDDQMHGHGLSTADLVHKRADLRHLMDDVQKLPETQRTALLLREMDVLSYDQIAETMETTVPSIKSLLVRARMSLAEAAEARQLSCEDVRRELAEIAEGLKHTTPPLKRHVRECEQCRRFRKQLSKTSTAMALAFPVGPFLVLKKLALTKLGVSALAGGAGGGGAAAGGAAATGGLASGGLASGGLATGGLASGGLAASGAGAASVGVGAAASKAIAGIAVTALLAGGAVEAKKVTTHESLHRVPVAAQVAAPPKPVPTGGVSLGDASPAVVDKVQAATQQADAAAKSAAEQAADPAKDETGATGATGAQGDTPPAEGATGTEGAVTDGGPGSPSQPETGGAAVPPAGTVQPGAPAAQGAPATGSSTAPAGTTGPY